jgi:hypothetical protein
VGKLSVREEVQDQTLGENPSRGERIRKGLQETSTRKGGKSSQTQENLNNVRRRDNMEEEKRSRSRKR